jgi:hypothetical protein
MNEHNQRKEKNNLKTLFLIKRGPKADYHRAPFHPVIICDRKRIAKDQAGNTSDKAWIWTREGWGQSGAGWLLERWEGLDIDYFPVVYSSILPDGYITGIYRLYPTDDPRQNITAFFNGAVWWSDKPMPDWLQALGVIYAPDQFTRQQILDDCANDGGRGFPRAEPDFWPPVLELKPLPNGVPVDEFRERIEEILAGTAGMPLQFFPESAKLE